MKLNKATLLEALQAAKAALLTQEYVPIQTHFIFDGEGVQAYNDNLSIRVFFKNELSCALPGSVLLKLVSSMSAKEVTFEQSGDNEIQVKSGRTRMKLPMLPVSDSTYQEPPTDDSTIVLDGTEKLLTSIARCMMSVGPPHASNLSEKGITLSIAKSGKATMYSTDNRTLSRSTFKADILEGSGPFKLVLSQEFCSNLLNLASIFKDEPIELAVQDDFVIAYFGEVAEIAGAIQDSDDQYDFEQILNSFAPDHAEGLKTQPIPDAVEGILQRSLILVGENKDKELRVTVDGETIEFFSTSTYGEVKDQVAFKRDMGDFTFMVDPALMQRAMTHTAQVAFLETAVVFTEGNFLHAVSHNHAEGGSEDE